MQLDKEVLKTKIKKLQEEHNALESEIYELQAKQDDINKQLVKYSEDIQRLDFKGMTKNEYLNSIRDMRISEGDFTVLIGHPNLYSIHVETKEDDMRITLQGSFESYTSGTLRLHRPSNRIKNIKSYDKSYLQRQEVPKNRLEIYDKMLLIKNKYAERVLNATLLNQND